MTTADLFTATRKHARVAEVFLDQHSLGLVACEGDITPAMRSHGVTMNDLAPVLKGRVRGRTFRCRGKVRIVGVTSVASISALAAA